MTGSAAEMKKRSVGATTGQMLTDRASEELDPVLAKTAGEKETV